jgi:hypothetical protein
MRFGDVEGSVYSPRQRMPCNSSTRNRNTLDDVASNICRCPYPLPIGINANKMFQLYASGVIRAEDCPPAPHTDGRGVHSSTSHLT